MKYLIFLVFVIHISLAESILLKDNDGNLVMTQEATQTDVTPTSPGATSLSLITRSQIKLSLAERVRALCSRYSHLLQGATDKRKVLENVEGVTSRDACLVMVACKFQTQSENRCPAMTDDIGTCFPETLPNVTSSVACPEYYRGIPYDTSDNVTRTCLQNGTWDLKSDYNACRPILDTGMVCSALKSYFRSKQQNIAEGKSPCDNHLKNYTIIAYVGRSLSLFTLAIAFILFWTLRSIRCWRNIIHWNFTSSMILRNVFWILLHSLITAQSRRENTVACRVLVTIFNYSQVTNYFWMFAEGLYLHMMVVLAYTSDRLNLKVYLLIGWGVPIPIISLWLIIKQQYENEICWMPSEKNKMADYFYQVPILIILLINAAILANIVRILITKLKSRGVGENHTQYTKAVKAALFLFPLLGVTYIIFFISPDRGTTGEIVFFYTNTIMQSFQGFFVCSIYCFANSEIQSALVKKLRSWKYHGTMRCLNREGPRRRQSTASFSKTTFMIVNTKSGKQAEDSDAGSIPGAHSKTPATCQKLNWNSGSYQTEVTYTPASRSQSRDQVSCLINKDHSDSNACNDKSRRGSSKRCEDVI